MLPLLWLAVGLCLRDGSLSCMWHRQSPFFECEKGEKRVMHMSPSRKPDWDLLSSWILQFWLACVGFVVIHGPSLLCATGDKIQRIMIFIWCFAKIWLFAWTFVDLFRGDCLQRESCSQRLCCKGLQGPVLSELGWVACPARRVKLRRVLGAKRRGKFRMMCCLAYKQTHASCPLSGGGGKAKSKLNVLASAVQELASQVQHLEARFAPKAVVREKKPFKKRPKNKPAPQDGNCIFDQLVGALKSWSGKDGKPKDEDVKAFLNQLLRGNPVSSKQKKAPASKPSKPRDGLGGKDVPSSAPKLWSDLFKSASPAQSSKNKFRLFAAAWTAPVVQAPQLKNHPLDDKVVICCNSSREELEAKEWIAARGCSHHVTYVTFNVPDADSSVLVQGSQGPHNAKAKIEKSHEMSPGRFALPTAVKDDEPRPDEKKGHGTVFLRLTVAKDFADAEITTKTALKPECLPAVVLSSCKDKILQTKAAINYPKEVTCLIRVREDCVQNLLSISLPIGVFLNRQKSKLVPRWFYRSDSQSFSQYWVSTKQECDKAKGRMVYRPSPNAPLGYISDSAIDPSANTVAPRWFVSNTPVGWSESDLTSWCNQRGLLKAENVVRYGPKSWFVRAFPPKEVDSKAMTFSSGITIALAAPKKKERPNCSGLPGKSAWGAPNPSSGSGVSFVSSARLDARAARSVGCRRTQVG